MLYPTNTKCTKVIIIIIAIIIAVVLLLYVVRSYVVG